jgi:hypothetical protein
MDRFANHTSDADVRGEHDHAPQRAVPQESPIAEQLRRRQDGHYVAGSEGTQDVAAPSAESGDAAAAESPDVDRDA